MSIDEKRLIFTQEKNGLKLIRGQFQSSVRCCYDSTLPDIEILQLGLDQPTHKFYSSISISISFHLTHSILKK